MSDRLVYNVPGVSCEHCRAAIAGEVSRVRNVASVAVDLDRKVVAVSGDDLDDAAIKAAIEEAGYEVSE